MTNGEIVGFTIAFTVTVLICIGIAVWHRDTKETQRITEKYWQRKNLDSSLPAYERLALAAERRAERFLNMDDPASAHRYLINAAKIRHDAMKAMERGEDPILGMPVEYDY